jgi:hypothetical protein
VRAAAGGAPACGIDLAVHLLARYYGRAADTGALQELQYVLPDPAQY